MAPASCIETGLRRGGRGGLRPRRWYTWQPCQIDRALHDSSPSRASEHGAGERRAGAGCGRVGGAEGGASLSGDGAGALDDIGPQCVVSCGAHARVVCQLRAGGVGALKLLPMMLLIKLKLPLTFICYFVWIFLRLGHGHGAAWRMGRTCGPPPTPDTPKSISSSQSPAHRFLGSCSVFGHYSKPKRGESVSGYGRPV